MSLAVKIPTAGGFLELKNPIMPAAASFGNIVEFADYLDLNRLGAVIPNSIALHTGQPTTAKKLDIWDYGMISALSLNNVSIDAFEREILPQLPYRTTPVIVNTKAADADEMAELAAMINEIDGIAAVEINLNCPYGVPGARPYWREPSQLTGMIRRVRDAAPRKTIIAKAPTAECHIETVGQACEAGGADIFTSYNSMGGCAIDIRTRKFRCGKGGSGGYSGPGFKPVGLHLCYRACKTLSIPVIGVGGITCAEDVLEYIMAGASAVQVGSLNLTRPDAMAGILDDLERLMAELGVASLEDIRGCVSVE